MKEFLVANEAAVRLAAFFAVLVVMAAWEALAPRRRRSVSRRLRWPANLGLVALDAILLRLLLPAGTVGIALLGEARGWGVFGLVPVPFWFAVVASLVVLDLAIYLQHVLFHAVPTLWRLHRVHHADLDIDVTTGARFHPIEIVLSMGIRLAVVVALGAPAMAVVIFELLLNATAMFNHANLRLPQGVDRFLRWVVVTPDMHRVHHSVAKNETNSNFGFNLPWWDRLFATYRANPAAGHEAMTIGLDRFRDPRELRLYRLLTQPFRGGTGAYPINGGEERVPAAARPARKPAS